MAAITSDISNMGTFVNKSAGIYVKNPKFLGLGTGCGLS